MKFVPQLALVYACFGMYATNINAAESRVTNSTTALSTVTLPQINSTEQEHIEVDHSGLPVSADCVLDYYTLQVLRFRTPIKTHQRYIGLRNTTPLRVHQYLNGGFAAFRLVRPLSSEHFTPTLMSLDAAFAYQAKSRPRLQLGWRSQIVAGFTMDGLVSDYQRRSTIGPLAFEMAINYKGTRTYTQQFVTNFGFVTKYMQPIGDIALRLPSDSLVNDQQFISGFRFQAHRNYVKLLAEVMANIHRLVFGNWRTDIYGVAAGASDTDRGSYGQVGLVFGDHAYFGSLNFKYGLLALEASTGFHFWRRQHQLGVGFVVVRTQRVQQPHTRVSLTFEYSIAQLRERLL